MHSQQKYFFNYILIKKLFDPEFEMSVMDIIKLQGKEKKTFKNKNKSRVCQKVA